LTARIAIADLKTTPSSADGYENAARAAKDPDEAIRLWEAGIAAFPQSHDLHEGLCGALLADGHRQDARRAEALARRALEIDPKNHPCGDHANLARALHLQKRHAEALTEIDCALKSCPGHGGAAELRQQIEKALAQR
jgi:tetratricopeptide (TPR) repeat protein